MDVSDTTTAETTFQDIAKRLGFHDIQTSQQAVQCLSDIKQSWLLVLDNADDPLINYYQRYFPSAQSGVIILTSRNAKCGQYTGCGLVPNPRHIELEKLSLENARELLLKSSGTVVTEHGILQDDADAIASRLSCHPLALTIAGNYISCGFCKLTEYNRKLEDKRGEMFGFQPEPVEPRNPDIYATFEISAQEIQKRRGGGRRAGITIDFRSLCTKPSTTTSIRLCMSERAQSPGLFR